MFSPEKNHKLQLQALSELFRAHPEYRRQPEAVELIVLGSVRDAFDQARVDELERLAKELDIQVLLPKRAHPAGLGPLRRQRQLLQPAGASSILAHRPAYHGQRALWHRRRGADGRRPDPHCP